MANYPIDPDLLAFEQQLIEAGADATDMLIIRMVKVYCQRTGHPASLGFNELLNQPIKPPAPKNADSAKDIFQAARILHPQQQLPDPTRVDFLFEEFCRPVGERMVRTPAKAAQPAAPGLTQS
ncbi:MAG: hypothetical protein L6Q57_08290 [Alphaproteobacteria bacterium]|nr:hypothetical protein [Alphaproteobacteria bacterium]